MTNSFTFRGHVYTLTTDHPASSYGIPVLVDEAGRAYGQHDVIADHWARDLVEHFRPQMTGDDRVVERFIGD